MFDAEPDGWEQTTLGAIATLGGGTTPSKSKESYWSNGSIPWATPSDITSLPNGTARISETEIAVTDCALKDCSLPLNPPGTVLMTSRATIGYAALNDVPMATNQGFITFRCGGGADPEFLLHWLTAKRDFLVAAAGGSTFKELSRGTAKLLPILLPPLDEQRRIAEVLRSVDEAISATGEIERHFRATSASLMEELVSHGTKGGTKRPTGIGDVPMGWDVVRLSDLLTIKHGFAFSSDFFRRESGDTILLTPGNFSTNKTLYFGPNTKFYDGPIPDGFVLSDGDILVVMTDLTQDMAILGNTVRLRSDRRVLHNQRIGKVEPIDPRRIDSGYARLLLNSMRVQKAVKSTASGTTVRHTSPSKILEILVALPPLDEQVEIAKIAHEIEAASDQSVVADDRSLRSETLSRLVSAKAAIATDLLSGRVRVPA